MAGFEVLTAEDASVLTGGKIPLWRIWESCRTGQLPHKRIGNRIYILRSSFESWLGVADITTPSVVA